MNFMNVYTETQVTMTVIFFFINTFNFSNKTREYYTAIYEAIYLACMILGIVFLVVHMIVTNIECIALCIRKRCCKDKISIKYSNSESKEGSAIK